MVKTVYRVRRNYRKSEFSSSEKRVDEDSSLVGYAVVASQYRHFGGMYCLSLKYLAVLVLYLP